MEVHSRIRTIFREAGAALALLSLYVLMLLTPLHQAAGLQRDLDSLGYASLDIWSICQPLTVDGDQEQPGIAKCPVAGVGKSDVILATPPSIHVSVLGLWTAVSYPAQISLDTKTRLLFVGQARAPPVAV